MPATKTIDVSIPHRLGRDEAKARIQGGAEKFRAQFGGQLAHVEENWSGYHADFKFGAMGQSITGRMDVESDAIKISVDLPWMLAMIAEKVRGRITEEGRRLLEKRG
jgi:hypothetical protein